MDTHDRLPVSGPLRSTSIPIAQLSPDIDGLEDRTIHSTVTLLWPYSSSSKSFSLLLAEPDFRLRRSNGQVKVHFHNQVAEQVAKSQVGIGDSVYLNLTGSRFVDESAVQTPSKRVSWAIHFDNYVLLEVWRDSKLLSIVKVDRPSSTQLYPDCSTTTPSTPVANGHSVAIGSTRADGLTLWRSPAFLSPSRAALGFVNLVSDPFAEEDGFVPGRGRKRPRFSMRSNEWRVIDEPEHPEDKDLSTDWMTIFDEDQQEESDAGEENTAENAEVSGNSATNQDISPDITTVQPPPETLELGMEQSSDLVNHDAQFLHPNIAPKLGGFGSIEQDTQKLPTDTPRLQPIPSPGLPIPSPLVTTSNSPSGYFTSIIGAAQTQFTPPTSAVSQVTSESEISIIAHAHIDIEKNNTNEDKPSAPAVTDQIPPESISTIHETTDTTLTSNFVQITNAEEGAEPREKGEIAVKENEAVERPENLADAALLEEQPLAEDSEGDPELGKVEETGGPTSHEENSDKQGEDDVEMYVDRPEDLGRGGSLVDDEQRLEPESQHLPDESDGVSEITGHDRGNTAEVVELSEDDAEPAQSEVFSPKVHVETSEDRGYDEYSEEEDEYGREEEEIEEEEAEEDFTEDELEDEPDVGRYYSESVVESDYSEDEARTDMMPKTTEPEIIVLDSDSEDEPPPRPSVHHLVSRSDEDSIEYRASRDSESDDYPMGDEEDMDDLAEEDEAESLGGGDSEDDQYMETEQDIEEHEELEQPDAELHEEELTDHQDYYVRERSNGQSDATPAGSHTSQKRSPEPQEQDLRVEFEEVQNTPLHTPFDDSYDSYDNPEYLRVDTQSVSQSHTDIEHPRQIFDLAIDPKLYQTGQLQPRGDVHTDKSSEHGHDDIEEPKDETPSRDLEKRHNTDLGLQLDGQFSPEITHVTSIALRETSIPPRIQQLATPSASQPARTDRDALSAVIPGDMPPTPELTQNNSSSQFASEAVSLLQEIPVEIPLVSKDDVFALAGEIKKEDNPAIEHEEQHIPQEGLAVEDTETSRLLNEDQALQASIEADDESEGGLEDRVCLVPVNRNYPGLRSKLSYFAPLATLIDHYNSLTDTISIVSEFRPAKRTTTGKKDFLLSLHLTDPSMAGTAVEAQILRPYKAALPSVVEGDAILLRNFRVKSVNHSVLLVSESTSAWAVFSGSRDEPEMNGPPVEYDSQESFFATDLRQWYQEGGIAMVADYQLQASVDQESRDPTPVSSPALSDSGSMDLAMRDIRGETSTSNRGSRRRKSQHRRVTIHELRDGRRYVEVGSPSGKDSIHQLRDGTVYANL